MARRNLSLTPEQVAAHQARIAATLPKKVPPNDDDVVKNPAKPRRYRNVPTEVNGVRFDSKHEAAVWAQLVERERRGEIAHLRRQVKFALVVAGIHVADFVADFCWTEGQREVVGDAKSEITRKDRTYRLKKKLMQAIHRMEIIEL